MAGICSVGALESREIFALDMHACPTVPVESCTGVQMLRFSAKILFWRVPGALSARLLCPGRAVYGVVSRFWGEPCSLGDTAGICPLHGMLAIWERGF